MGDKVINKHLIPGGGSPALAAAFVGLFVLASTIGSAQKTDQNNKAVINAGRPMSAMDSATVKQLFFSALREKTVENMSLASDFFDRVIQIDPANDAAMYELAIIKKTKSNYGEAQSLLEKAVTVKSDNEWYWSALADCYEKNGQIDKLENVFNELIRINPDKADYYYDKANVYFIQKRYDDALKAYDKIEELTGPTDDLLANRQKIYLKLGKVDLAAQQLQKMIADDPNQVKYYLYLSQLYTSNNLNDKGLKVLQTAVKIAPSNGLIHLALADIYRDKQNIDASFSELELAFASPDVDISQKIKIIFGYTPKFPDPNARASALELSKILITAHPNDSRAYAIYGDMLLQNEKFKDAKEMYRKSIALNSQVYEVQEQLVRIELGDSDTDSAIRDGENSLSFFPNQAWMNYLVGVAYLQKKNSAKAVEYLKNATSLEMADKDLLSQSYSALGDSYHELRDTKASDAAYEKALSYNADNAFVLNNYAYYLSLRGEQLDKAARMSKRSNELQGGNAAFEDTYAWILFKLKDYTNARVWMEKALAHDKNKSAVKSEHYGDILFYLGDVDGAVANWKIAKANGDQSPVLDKKIDEKKYLE